MLCRHESGGNGQEDSTSNATPTIDMNNGHHCEEVRKFRKPWVHAGPWVSHETSALGHQLVLSPLSRDRRHSTHILGMALHQVRVKTPRVLNFNARVSEFPSSFHNI